MGWGISSVWDDFFDTSVRYEGMVESEQGDRCAVKEWVRVFVGRRCKSILDLPEKTWRTVELDMDELESRLYSNLLEEALNRYLRSRPRSRLRKRGIRYQPPRSTNVLSLLIKLRQVCNHPLLMMGRNWTKPYALDLESPSSRNEKNVTIARIPPSSWSAWSASTRVWILSFTRRDATMQPVRFPPSVDGDGRIPE